MMKAFNSLFKTNKENEPFDAIKIGIASPEKIRSWSYGEVRTTNVFAANTSA